MQPPEVCTRSDDCCGDAARALSAQHRNVLWAVLAINSGLFLLELIAGARAGSSALLGDSLDMLGDALIYAASLFVVDRSRRAQAQVAGAKGLVMFLLGLVVLCDTAVRAVSHSPPPAELVGAIGLVALCGNALCFALLFRHRADNLNFRSTWICSRNDLIANVAVIGSAALVAVTASRWPDAVVGASLAGLWLRSALRVVRETRLELART
jgi:Co/Zn/Cd efflux system component